MKCVPHYWPLETKGGSWFVPKALAVVCTAFCLAAAGCGEKLQELKEKVSEQVEQAVEKGVEKTKGAVQQAQQQVAPQPEGVELDAGGPLKAEVCFATLTSVRAGEPAVLQLSTFESGKRETYPSIYVRAEVSAANLAALQGQKLQAQIYVQNDAEAPVWQTPEGAYVELAVVAATNERITCEVLQGQLVNLADGSTVQLKGKFFAKVPPAS